MLNINDNKIIGNESSKENDLSLINYDLLSGQKSNFKTRNEASNSLSDNNIKKFFQSNYSFSDKTIENEFSKKIFESIQEELIPKNGKSNKCINKKERQVCLNHSDYFYCPESKTEKNLNDQINKYLKENNLEIKRKSKKSKNIINNFNINNIFEIIKNQNNYTNESKILDNNIYDNIIKLKDKKGIYIEPVSEKETISHCLQQYLEQMKKYKNYNAPINQINNIKIKNIYISNNEKDINTFDKNKCLEKETKNYHNIKTEQLNNSKKKINNHKKSFNCNPNNKYFSSKCNINNKENYFIAKKNKANNKSNYNMTNKKKSFSNIETFDGKNILKNNKNNEYEIDSNIVNEKIIGKTKNMNKKEISNLETISLQSLNDSKLMLIADDLIKKEDEFK